jgi:hypothetical protein
MGIRDARAAWILAGELSAADDAQLRPIVLGLEDRRLPLPWQVFEAVGIEQRLVKLRRCWSLISDSGG